MTLDDFIKLIREKLNGEIDKKATGKYSFEANLSQGGIGDTKVRTEGRLKDQSE